MLHQRRYYIASIIVSCAMITTQATASYRSTSAEPGGYFWIDYLRWKAEEDQLSYALFSQTGFNPPQGKIFEQEPCFQWDSGVRIGGGYQFCSEWDFFVTWTHFNETTNTSIKGSAGQILAVALNTAIGSIFGNAASTQWCLKLNLVDIDIATIYSIGNCFAVRPYIGVKWAGIKQHQNIAYQGLQLNADLLPDATVARINNFSGAGPHIGLQGIWDMSHGFHLIGTAAAALLYGKLCINSQYNFNISSSTAVDPHIFDNKHRLRPTFQLFLALGWETSFCDDAYALEAHIGYEGQYFFTQWQNQVAVSFQSISTAGDLMLQGMLLGASFSF